MFCNKCGHQLNDGESFCTNCGNPVSLEIVSEKKEEVLDEEKVEEVKEDIIEEKVEEPELVIETKIEDPVLEEKIEEPELVIETKIEDPVLEEKIEEPVVFSTEPVIEDSSTSNGVSRSAKVGGIIFAVILGVGIISWIVLTLLFNANMKKSKEEVVPTPSPSESPKPSIKPSPKPTNSKKNASYGGYQFSYPSDFTTKDLNESGFLFKNDDVAFTVLVDYTHTFEDYEQYSIDIYGEEDTSESHEILGGSSYLFFYQKTVDLNYYTYIYVTESNDGDVFIGQFSMLDHSSASLEDVQIIDEILRTGEFDLGFTKQDDYDYGKDEIHFPEFDNYFF